MSASAFRGLLAVLIILFLLGIVRCEARIEPQQQHGLPAAIAATSGR